MFSKSFKKFVGGFVLLVQTAYGAVPDDCFITSPRINDLGADFPITSDQRAIANLTPDHRISSFKQCSSDSKIVGI